MGDKGKAPRRPGACWCTGLLAILGLVGAIFFCTLGLSSWSETTHHEVTKHPVEIFEFDSKSRWVDFDGNFEYGKLRPLAATKLRGAGAKTADEAHASGELHRGVAVAVLRPAADRKRNDCDVLLTKRASHMATCAGSWTLVGEHAMEGETFRQTAVRALSEELGLGKDGVEIADLLPPAEGGGESFVLLQTPYADLERDLQATGVFAAKLSRRAARSVSFDKDVDEWKWVEQGELRDVDACTPEIAALNRVIRDKLWDAFPRKKGV